MSTSSSISSVKCVGNVIARPGCWSFLKGGFVLDLPSSYGLLYLQRSDGEKLNISISSVSLQPFTYQLWKKNQQDAIDKVWTVCFQSITFPTHLTEEIEEEVDIFFTKKKKTTMEYGSYKEWRNKFLEEQESKVIL
nr:uncharacterized protein LOC104648447 isoform X2 [Solanum lycopersicum]